MADTTTAQLDASLGVGAIIGESFRITFRNFFALLGVMILPIVAIVVAGVLILGATFLSSFGDPLVMEQEIAADPTGFLMLYGLFMVIAVFFACFMYSALVKAIFDAKMTGGVQIGAAMRTGMARGVQLFVVSVVYMILFALVVGVVAGILGFIGLPAVSVVVAGILTLYILGVTAPLAVVTVVENRWMSSIGRTIGLTKGFRWPIIGAMFLIILLVLLIGFASVLIAALVSMLGAVGTVIGLVVNLLVSVITYGASFAMVILIYTRLREIKEGTSTDQLAEIFS